MSSIVKISCPNCSNKFLVRHQDFSSRAICNSCFHIVDISSDDHMSLAGFDREYKFDPLISIGQSGKLLGETFEVIGCLRLADKDHPDYKIFRYLLYSPTQSYRWLTDEHGHWTISRLVDDLQTEDTAQEIEYRGQTYAFDHRSNQALVFAVGEFYWPLKKNDLFEMRRFISPPYELALSSLPEKKIYLGRYLNLSQVTSAFKLVKTLQKPIDSVPHEVSPVHHLVKEFFWTNIAFLIVCFFIQWRGQQTPPSLVHHGVTDEASLATEPFEIRGEPTALEVKISGANRYPLQVSLDEIRSKTKYNLEVKNTSQRLLFSQIPSGVYLFRASIANLSVSIYAGAKSASNIMFAALLLSLPTLVLFAIDQIFNFKRRKRK